MVNYRFPAHTFADVESGGEGEDAGGEERGVAEAEGDESGGVFAMGFLDQVLNVLGKAVNVVVYSAGTITGIAVAGVVEFTPVAFEKFGEYRTKNRNTNLSQANQPVLLLTKDLNNEIMELERKKKRDRSLNQYENQKLIGLHE